MRPAYLDLGADEIERRAEAARALLGPERCTVCPRLCRSDRLSDEKGLCAIGRRAVVASYFPHFGEENCLRGWNGSGTIFFSGCNLRCVFCLVPGALITTNRGPRRVEELFAEGSDQVAVAEGVARRLSETQVRTVTGEFAPAVKAFRHPHRGEVMTIKPMLAPEVTVTPDHEVYAALRTEPQNLQKVPAGELTDDHLLVVPKIPMALERTCLDVDEILTGAPIYESQRPRRVPERELVAALRSSRTSRELANEPAGPAGRERTRWLDEGSHFLVPIDRVERRHYEGPVYNLEVDHSTRSYMAPAIAVGNCQNHDISWEVQGERVEPARLASMMLELQERGCHNINFVTPEHVVPQILEALPLAIAGGLRLPIVYNTSSYDSLDSLHLMDGIVDVYMPDFKLVTRSAARRYLRMPDYADVAKAAVVEMNRQVGPLVFDDRGLAGRGLLLRHLVMPGMFEETEAVLRFVAEHLGPETYVDLMAQYYPAGLVGKPDQRDDYAEIDRHLHREEYLAAVEIGRSLSLRLDARSVGSAERLTPAP